MNNTLILNKQDKEQFLFWVATLMSGVFKKGKFALNPTEDSYCCLGIGVACTIPEKLLEKDEEGKLKHTIPGQQNHCPRWLANVNTDFINKNQNEFGVIGLNDSIRSHKQIGKRLLEVYEEELNNI